MTTTVTLTYCSTVVDTFGLFVEKEYQENYEFSSLVLLGKSMQGVILDALKQSAYTKIDLDNEVSIGGYLTVDIESDTSEEILEIPDLDKLDPRLKKLYYYALSTQETDNNDMEEDF